MLIKELLEMLCDEDTECEIYDYDVLDTIDQGKARDIKLGDFGPLRVTDFQIANNKIIININ